MKTAVSAKNYIKHLALLFLFIACFTSFQSCTNKAADTIKAKYTVGQEYEELPLGNKLILLDFKYSELKGSPLMISLHGYTRPKRPLQLNERLVIVAEEFDLVSHLYFSSGKLVAVEVVGS